MTANDDIFDGFFRHQTYLQRHALGLAKNLYDPFVEDERELIDKIIALAARLDDENSALTGSEGRKFQAELYATVSEVRQQHWQRVIEESGEEFIKVAALEGVAVAKIIGDALPLNISFRQPAQSSVATIVKSRPFQGRTLKGWMIKNRDADIDRIVGYVKTSINNGLTISQIAKSLGSNRGMTKKARRDIESVVLTVSNGVASEARQTFYTENNLDYLNERFVATLDGRTTIVCAANDGETFKPGKGLMPPLHFVCRSLRVPFFSADSLNRRGFDWSQPGMSIDQKRKLIGDMPADTTYSQTLKRQTNSFQDRVLGKARAQLFRDGKLTLDKFVSRDGDVYTLNELKQLYGVNP